MSRSRSPRRSILVEFVGAAGSGKTAVSEAVAKRLEHAGLSVGRALDARHIGPVRGAILAPRSALAWFRIVGEMVADDSARRRCRRKMFTLVGRIAWLARRNAVVIMDEGIVHRFRSVRASAGRDVSIAEAAGSRVLSSLFPIEPALLVSVHADVETIRARIVSRDDRLITRTSRDLARSDEQSLRDIEEILAACPGAARVRVQNQMPDDVSRLGTEIAERAQKILENRGR